MSPQVIFDSGPIQGGTVFNHALDTIRADAPRDVPAAFEAMEKAKSQGFWLAGYTSYELGYLFSPKLSDLIPHERTTPLLHFGVFKTPAPAQPLFPTGSASLTRPEPSWTFGQYNAAFSRIKEYIAAGDIYQANLTFPLEATYSGTPLTLYHDLRTKQPVPFGAFVDLGGPVLLSRSPELFFAVDERGQIETRPMKGTAPRGQTPKEDAANREWLGSSEKNRAENLMIVDLMRNDVSRLSAVGSVKVPELFTVETYTTLHQMTSRIVAQLLPRVTLHDIFAALFPCGSITGAPKIRAMQIIRSLEPTARNAYCGAIGWIAPNGTMQFNVAIRTLTCHQDGGVRLNVGGGVVHDSTGEEEYAEALVKSRYANLDRTRG